MRRTDAGRWASRPDSDRFPIDPDVDPVEDAPHHPGQPRLTPPLSRWPTFEASIVGLVFAGGCAGGLVRYLAVRHWPAASSHFPWATFVVNVAGAFVLAALIVSLVDLRPASRYLRPLIGTGFCGAMTTFSSIVVTADELAAHDHVALAATYVVVSIVGGLGAAVSGLAAARVLVRASRC
jgi:CrcB protein